MTGPTEARDDALERAREAIAREDRETAVAILRPLAEAGDPEAQFLFGSRFHCNLDLVPIEACYEWRRLAASDIPDTAKSLKKRRSLVGPAQILLAEKERPRPGLK